MNKTNELLFSALDGVWTEEEKEEASHFCEVNEAGITTLYAFEAICKYHVRLPQDLKIVYTMFFLLLVLKEYRNMRH